MQVGRPREFDTEKALDRALKIFWRKGFDGTSLSDLTEAMKINRPSLYSAYGDKETLFRLAMDRYVEVHAGYVRAVIEEPTARRVVEELWNGTIEVVRNPRNPQGCFLVQGALACGDAAQAVRQAMAKQRRQGENLLRKRFERAVTDGDLPPDTNTAELACYVATVSYGLSVQAAGGATVKSLEAVAAIAIRSIPG